MTNLANPALPVKNKTRRDTRRWIYSAVTLAGRRVVALLMPCTEVALPPWKECQRVVRSNWERWAHYLLPTCLSNRKDNGSPTWSRKPCSTHQIRTYCFEWSGHCSHGQPRPLWKFLYRHRSTPQYKGRSLQDHRVSIPHMDIFVVESWLGRQSPSKEARKILDSSFEYFYLRLDLLTRPVSWSTHWQAWVGTEYRAMTASNIIELVLMNCILNLETLQILWCVFLVVNNLIVEELENRYRNIYNWGNWWGW